jgi:hypothetical protein
MQTEEITQAIALFDTPEKWAAFLALTNQKDNLRQAMLQKAFSRVSTYFLKEHLVPEWSFKPLSVGDFAMVWYLTKYGEYSVCLVLAWKGEFVLEARGGSFHNQVEKTTELLREPRFSVLKSCFERIDVAEDERFMAREKFNFSFGTPSDTRFGPFRLAWHAHYETESFVDQIAAKVARFQTPEMTELLDELNALTRKDA